MLSCEMELLLFLLLFYFVLTLLSISLGCRQVGVRGYLVRRDLQVGVILLKDAYRWTADIGDRTQNLSTGSHLNH